MLDEKNITLQIFGNLLKNSSILDRTDKYFLTANDFSSSFERRLFAIILTPHTVTSFIREWLLHSPTAAEILFLPPAHGALRTQRHGLKKQAHIHGVQQAI